MEPLARIRSVIRTVAQKDIDPPADEPLFTSGVLDSFALPDLVSALEEEFGVEIPDEDAEKIATVQNAIDYINAKSS